MIWSKFAFAAAAFQAEPSWKVTPLRRVNSISYRLFERVLVVQLVASAGLT